MNKTWTVYCLICDRDIGEPQLLDENEDMGLVIGLINKNYCCLKCNHLPYYNDTFIKLNMREIDNADGRV